MGYNVVTNIGFSDHRATYEGRWHVIINKQYPNVFHLTFLLQHLNYLYAIVLLMFFSLPTERETIMKLFVIKKSGI